MAVEQEEEKEDKMKPEEEEVNQKTVVMITIFRHLILSGRAKSKKYGALRISFIFNICSILSLLKPQ